MAIDFPNSPTTGQEFTSGSNTWTYDGSKWNLKTASGTSNDSMPVGSLMWFATTTTTPPGWIAADGTSYPTSTYPNLFAVIGYTHGGSGANFNVPNVASTTGKYYVRYTTAVGTTTTTSLATAPVGTMIDWPVTSSYPTGWLLADGTAYSRTTYNDLFTLIGTTYGTGDGSTTFNLPNLPQAGAGAPVKIIKATLSGTVEPSTVSHAATHVRLGSDVIDGDRVQVDYTPTYYTRDSSDANAGANTDLTAHLKGVDNKLYLPGVRVYKTSNVASYVASAKISWDSAANTSGYGGYNPYSMWTSGTNITIPKTGIYVISGYSRLTGTSAFNWQSLDIFNGVTLIASELGTFASTTDYRASAHCIIQLAANDVITMACNYSGGGTVTLDGTNNYGYTRLSVQMVTA